jgi:hypothetical protein
MARWPEIFAVGPPTAASRLPSLPEFCDMTPCASTASLPRPGAAGVATLATVRLTPAGTQTLPGPRPGAAAASAPFILGVASGDSTPGGVVLWTRLAPTL